MMSTSTRRRLFAFLLVAVGSLALPAVAFAAEGSGSKWGAWLNIGRVFNLGVMVLVLYWVASKPLKEFYAGRTQSIREQLSEAQQAREEAEAKLAEIEARMGNLNDELLQMKLAAEKEARDEYQRLIAEAEHDADVVIERARAEIDGMMRTARKELKAYVAELSVGAAEEQIRAGITDEDRRRLFGRFVNQLGGKS